MEAEHVREISRKHRKSRATQIYYLTQFCSVSFTIAFCTRFGVSPVVNGAHHSLLALRHGYVPNECGIDGKSVASPLVNGFLTPIH